MSAVLRHHRLPGIAALAVLGYFIADWWLPSTTPAAVVITGLAVTVVGAASAVQQRITGAPGTLLATAGLALAISGVIGDRPLGAGLLTMFTVLAAVGIFLIGTDGTGRASVRLLLGAAGLAALVCYFSRISGQIDSYAPAVYPVLTAVIVLGWLYQPDQPAPARQTIDGPAEVSV
jgi:hypothetical protein